MMLQNGICTHCRGQRRYGFVAIKRVVRDDPAVTGRSEHGRIKSDPGAMVDGPNEGTPGRDIEQPSGGSFATTLRPSARHVRSKSLDSTRSARLASGVGCASSDREYELPGVSIEWAAAIGLLEGVFTPPAPLPKDWLDPASLEVLPPGVQFYRWLVAEKAALDHAKRIVCRRAMKALSPRLMKEVLARKG